MTICFPCLYFLLFLENLAPKVRIPPFSTHLIVIICWDRFFSFCPRFRICPCPKSKQFASMIAMCIPQQTQKIGDWDDAMSGKVSQLLWLVVRNSAGRLFENPKKFLFMYVWHLCRQGAQQVVLCESNPEPVSKVERKKSLVPSDVGNKMSLLRSMRSSWKWKKSHVFLSTCSAATTDLTVRDEREPP